MLYIKAFFIYMIFVIFICAFVWAAFNGGGVNTVLYGVPCCASIFAWATNTERAARENSSERRSKETAKWLQEHGFKGD